jgi:hypothetical protein
VPIGPVDTAPAPNQVVPAPEVSQPSGPQLLEEEGSDSGPPAALIGGMALFALIAVAIIVWMIVGQARDTDAATRRRRLRTIVAVGLVLVLVVSVALAAAG